MRARRVSAGFVLFVSTLFGVTSTVSVASPAEAREPFTVTECEGVTDSVFRLYTAALGRRAEQEGYEFWLGAYQRADFSLVSAADFFVKSPEFESKYGALDNRAYVERLYQNVLGRPGEPGGVDFWSEQLDSGARSRAIVLLDFSESPENVVATDTVVPSLGYFNRGLDGPWSCVDQPADNTCSVVDGTFAATYDVTVTVPPDNDDDGHAIRVQFDVFRNGSLIGNLGMTIKHVEEGDRVRDTGTIVSDFNRDVPASEQTCVVTSVEPTNIVFGGERTAGDAEAATCVITGRDTLFGAIQLESAAVNPLAVTADMRPEIGVFLDGFRIGEVGGVARDVPAGALATDGGAIAGHLVPQGIDLRRVTCDVYEVYWLEAD